MSACRVVKWDSYHFSKPFDLDLVSTAKPFFMIQRIISKPTPALLELQIKCSILTHKTGNKFLSSSLRQHDLACINPAKLTHWLTPQDTFRATGRMRRGTSVKLSNFKGCNLRFNGNVQSSVMVLLIDALPPSLAWKIFGLMVTHYRLPWRQ